MKNLSAGDSFEGRYEIRTELGRDRHAVTYRAWSSDSGHEVVVRLLLPPASEYPPGFDARFMSEAKHVAKLRHPAAVRLESFGATSEGTLFLVSELVPGVPLSEHPVMPADVVGLVARLAACLAEAHARGIIHRDLTPRHVIVPPGYGVSGAKLRGFGVTSAADDVDTANPRYISPEQLTGAPSAPAANIYSLGLIFGELLTGEPMVRGTTAAQMHAIHLGPPELDIAPTVPPTVRPILQRMVAKNPQQRYASMDDVVEALRAVGRPPGDAAMAHTIRDNTHRQDATLLELNDVDIPTRERLNAVPRARRPGNPDFQSNVDATLLEAAIAEEIPTDEIDHRLIPRDAAAHSNDMLAANGSNRRKPPSSRPKSTAPRPNPASVDEDRVSPWVSAVVLLGAVGAAIGVANLVKAPAHNAAPVASRGNPLAPAQPDEAPPAPEVELPEEDAGEPELALPVTGCGAPVAPGWSYATEMSGLTERRHRVRIPQGYDGSPVPLMMVVRPLQAPAKAFIETTKIDAVAEELNAILIVPADGSAGLRPWFTDIEASMAEFARVLIHATTTYCIDDTQVYGIGASTGAAALELFSCNNPGIFDALGLVTSWVAPDTPCADSAARVYVNGKNDPVSPYDGGAGCWGGTYRAPVPDMVEQRRVQLNCGEEVAWAEYPDGSCHSFEGCDAPLAHCVVPRSLHEWPGSSLMPVHCPLVMPPPQPRLDFPTTEVIAEFLKARLATK